MPVKNDKSQDAVLALARMFLAAFLVVLISVLMIAHAIVGVEMMKHAKSDKVIHDFYEAFQRAKKRMFGSGEE